MSVDYAAGLVRNKSCEQSGLVTREEGESCEGEGGQRGEGGRGAEVRNRE